MIFGAVGIFHVSHREKIDQNSKVTVAPTIVDGRGVEKRNFFSIKMKMLPSETAFRQISNEFRRQINFLFFWSLPFATKRFLLPSESAEIVLTEKKRYAKRIFIENRRKNKKFRPNDDGIFLRHGTVFSSFLAENWTKIEPTKHSIDFLDKIFTEESRFLMKKNRISTIEDLIRLFFLDGERDFLEQLENRFHVQPNVQNFLVAIFRQWKNRNFSREI